MTNVMSMKNVRNKVHRSAFDLSKKNAFTAQAGALIPCFVQEVLPGDSFEIDCSHFTRSSPVNTAAYVRMKENVDFFFVPYKLLWDKWEQFIVRTNDPHYASSLTSAAGSFTSCPYASSNDLIAWLKRVRDFDDSTNGPLLTAGGTSYREGVFRLFDMLGYGTLFNALSAASGLTFPDRALNLFRFAAYQKIYYDAYRNSQWETSKPQVYNFDYVFKDADLKIDIAGSPQFALPLGQAIRDDMFTLRYSNFRKDKFLGILPAPQFGAPAIAGPISGNLVFDLTPNEGPAQNAVLSRGVSGHLVQGSQLTGRVVAPLSSSSTNLNAGISVLQMRIAEAGQKFREITQTGSKDYRDQIMKHWNARVPDYASTLVERVYSYDSSLDISEVVNTNLTLGHDADIAGKGTSAASGKFKWKNSAGQYGILMGIYHIEPLIDYSSSISLPAQLRAVTPDNYPTPEYDSIGMDSVTALDVVGYSPLVSLVSNTIGYAPRYYQWKTAVDELHCGFTTSSYNSWVSGFGSDEFIKRFSYSPGSGFGFSYITQKVFPQLLNSIFVSQVSPAGSAKAGKLPTYEQDQMLVNMFIGCKCARNLSSDGLPY